VCCRGPCWPCLCALLVGHTSPCSIACPAQQNVVHHPVPALTALSSSARSCPSAPLPCSPLHFPSMLLHSPARLCASPPRLNRSHHRGADSMRSVLGVWGVASQLPRACTLNKHMHAHASSMRRACAGWGWLGQWVLHPMLPPARLVRSVPAAPPKEKAASGNLCVREALAARAVGQERSSLCGALCLLKVWAHQQASTWCLSIKRGPSWVYEALRA